MDPVLANQVWQKMIIAKQWLITTHHHPDGDALSSINIFLELAKQLKKPCLAYCADLPSENFYFLANINQVTNQLTREEFDSCDLIIVNDCGNVGRCKLDHWLLTRLDHQTVVEFDHHERQDDYADISFKENQAAATTEVVYDFLTIIDQPISAEIAKSILTGLVSDTGNFLYSNTTGKATKIAAKMMLMGARLPKIINQIVTNKNLAVMHLWGRVLSELQINSKYNLAIAIVKQVDFLELGLTSDDLGGLAGLLGGLEGVVGSLLLIEEDGWVKGSLRTNLNNIDMSTLANFLGGGGHRKAAGFSFSGSIKQPLFAD